LTGVYGTMLRAPMQASSPYTTAFLAGDDLPNSWGPNGTVVPNDGLYGLQQATVFACVRVIAEDVASLPIHVYRRRGDGGKERDPGHRLYSLLHDAPNEEMSTVNFWETMVTWACTWGNAFAQIRTDRLGRVVPAEDGGGLWPLRSDRMRFYRNERRGLVYEYRTPGEAIPKKFTADEIFHLRGLSTDGLMGFSPIQMAGGPLLLAMAAERFGINFFDNGSRPGGVLTVKGRLSKDSADRLKSDFESMLRGSHNAHRVTVLEEDSSFHPLSIPPEDGQFLETREYQREEICGMYRVAPHMIASLRRSTNNNIEHQGLEHVIYCLRPWLRRIEAEIKRQLIPEATHFCEFLVDGLLRGDAYGRAQALQIQLQNGALSPNEWREIENRNPREDEDGDKFLRPMNMEIAGEPSEPEPALAGRTNGTGR
jgi:HK97 family phage portal protein